MQTSFIEGRGYCLHPIDLAINKTLALAGRDEARDFLDVLYANKNLLSLAGLVWAACGTDPGFSPDSLLELLQRKGRYHPEDFKRLRLNVEIDLHSLKREWLEALEQTRNSIARLPTAEVGCLFFDKSDKKFKVPVPENIGRFVPHFATIGGVVPRI